VATFEGKSVTPPVAPVRTDTRPGFQVQALGVSQYVRGGRRTLTDVSLTVAAGEVLAIVGASGAGKTTLLETLAGVRAPAVGTVLYDGVDYFANRTAFRSALGYVPQDDIIHRELPLQRTLRYAARLRLPAGTRSSHEAAVRAVLQRLGLLDRADTPVGSLSGGERKRASIAVELLTRPRVFFLDEPTSGLDSATAAEFMADLRGLADAGTTVVLTTHNLADAEWCDRIAVLSKDGTLAFVGAIVEARAHFAVTRLEDIYDRLDSAHGPDGDAAHRDRAPGRAPQQHAEPAASPVAPRDRPRDRPRVAPEIGPRPPGALAQWAVLARRNLDLLTRNRLTVAIVLGSPVVILLMLLVLFRAGAFSPAQPSPGTTAMILFWVAFGGFFFGLTYGLLQICTELPIVRRERLVAIGLGPYVLAKFAVLLPLLAAVDAGTVVVLQQLDRLPHDNWAQYGSFVTTLVLSSAVALGLGLLASAAVTDVSQAAIVLPMLCFPQVLFSGGIVPVPEMPTAGAVLSYPMSNRWAFEALGHSANLEPLWSRGGSPLGPPLLASFGGSFSRPVALDWAILAGLTATCLLGTVAVLARRLTTRPAPARRRSGAYQGR
jgi:ABC-type multidrug transport system ATPase subunit